MKRLHFTYDMQIEYSVPVAHCNFTIKCIPENTSRQNIENLKICIEPETSYQWGVDGFKNRYIWGKNSKEHTSFHFRLEGDADTGLSTFEETADPDLTMLFAHPHGLNKAGKTISRFFDDKIKSIEGETPEKVLKITQELFDRFKYQPGATDVDTDAETAFSQGMGVCQDYSHILISLLHMAGIPARYVTGFIIGEGKSHAWVEFLCKGKWQGIDPANNKPVNDEYIKLADGRDAADCTINRGIMHGGGAHTQTVNVSVKEIKERS